MYGTRNAADIIGRVGKNPEVRMSTGGMKIARFSLATKHKSKNGSGNKDEKEEEKAVEWHRIVAFDKLAEIAEKIVSKGDLIFVRGPIRTNEWKDEKTGEKKSIKEIWLNEIELLAKKKLDTATAEASA